MVKRLLKNNEAILFFILLILSIVFGMINPTFFSLGNVFDITKNSIEMGILSLGVLLVLISGGIDVSFMAISAFAMYSVVKLYIAVNPNANILLLFLTAAIIGALLGLFNAWLIHRFKLSAFIITLGTANVFRGILLSFVGSDHIIDIPGSLIDFSKMNIIEYVDPQGVTYGLHISVILLIILAVTIHLILKYTTMGRSIYAVGGDYISAERIGIHIKKVHVFVYCTAGLLAGINGIIHSSLVRMASPFDLVGDELNVIAAVVLGGASITGGKGSVLGTILGVLTIVTINSSLILLHVSSYWQKVVTGLIIIGAISLQAYQNKKKKV